MRKLLYVALALAIFGGLYAYFAKDVFGQTAASYQKGQEVTITFVCRVPMPIPVLFSALQEEQGKASALMRGFIQSRDCIMLPRPDQGLLIAILDSGEDFEGDMMYAVEIESPYNQGVFYSIMWEKAQKSEGV